MDKTTQSKIASFVLGLILGSASVFIGMSYHVAASTTERGFLPNAPNGTSCIIQNGIPGEPGFNVHSWHPRADGFCYLSDEH